MNKKSLEQLADEYSISRKNTEEQIASCRQKLKELKKAGRNFEITKLMRKLTVLYDQLDELNETEYHLRHYYSDEMRCAG